MPAPYKDEKELLNLLKAGDEQAFDQVYHLYSARIYGNILKMVKSPEIAEEILQDIFLKIWEKRCNIDPEKSFRSYLFTISRHLVYNFFHRGTLDKKMSAHLIALSTETYSHIEEDIYYKEGRHILQSAIEKLPFQCRRVFTLCKLEGKTYEEVSLMLGISTSTISNHIVKATRFIKEQYYLSEHMAFVALATAFFYQV